MRFVSALRPSNTANRIEHSKQDGVTPSAGYCEWESARGVAMAHELTRRRKIKLLRASFSNWPLVAVDKTGLAQTCVYRTRDGASIRCRPRTTDVNEAVAVLSGYEYPTHYLTPLSSRSLVVDGGANIGSFCVQVKRQASGIPALHAIEPFPANVELLRQNLSANSIKATVHPLALSNTEGSVLLDVDCSPDAVSIGARGTLASPAQRLSVLCAQQGVSRVSLLKLDVEGAEYQIVAADAAWLADSVELILLEYHEIAGRGGRAWLVEQLQGFTARDIHVRGNAGVLALSNNALGTV